MTPKDFTRASRAHAAKVARERRAYDNRTLVGLAKRRSELVRRLSDLSRGGWAGARFDDYAPLERELHQIDARVAEIEADGR